MKIKPILLMLLASAALAACGQKGPLYREPPPQDNKAKPVTNPPAEAPAQPQNNKD